jgi:LmbE family N-acetylglucosaminyl deacetylase
MKIKNNAIVEINPLKARSEQTILVVAAHPDDEILGCGGAMARHVALGHEVIVVILSEGQRSRESLDSEAETNVEVRMLRDAAIAAAKVIGISEIRFFSFPDNQFDSIPLLHLVKVIEECVREVKPQIVYTHHRGDLNIDHRLAAQAVITATRPIPDSVVRTVLAFEVLSSSEYMFEPSVQFIPNYFIDISDYLEVKQRAMSQYGNELRESPHPRSLTGIEALARLRGSVVGCEYAESFYLVRHLDV